jgi:hypothetical protein
MDDVKDNAKGGGYRRVEVLTGPGRWRKWWDDEKLRIVSETLQPGAMVTKVARRWQVCPQQVFGWRQACCTGRRIERIEPNPNYRSCDADLYCWRGMWRRAVLVLKCKWCIPSRDRAGPWPYLRRKCHSAHPCTKLTLR